MKQGRKVVANLFDTAGGIAGAGMVFCGVLLTVIAISHRRILTLALAAVFLAAGSLLAFTKPRGGLRATIGAVFLVVVIVAMLAALLLPGLHLY